MMNNELNWEDLEKGDYVSVICKVTATGLDYGLIAVQPISDDEKEFCCCSASTDRKVSWSDPCEILQRVQRMKKRGIK